MKKKLIGLLVGCALCLSTSTAFAAQQQYVLTPATYPVVVNGVPYSDTSHPILSLGGSTYVSLAKLGDLTGVQYTWNSELNRVEINTSVLPQGTVTIKDLSPDVKYDGGLPGGKITLTPNIKLVDEKKSYLYNTDFGTVQYHAYNRFYGSIQTFTDEDDTVSAIARIQSSLIGGDSSSQTPPKLSEGWISNLLLSKAHSISIKVDYEGNEIILHGPRPTYNPERLAKFTIPPNWGDIKYADKIINDVQVIKHGEHYFFNIDDLIKTGIIK